MRLVRFAYWGLLGQCAPMAGCDQARGALPQRENRPKATGKGSFGLEIYGSDATESI